MNLFTKLDLETTKAMSYPTQDSTIIENNSISLTSEMSHCTSDTYSTLPLEHSINFSTYLLDQNQNLIYLTPFSCPTTLTDNQAPFINQLNTLVLEDEIQPPSDATSGPQQQHLPSTAEIDNLPPPPPPEVTLAEMPDFEEPLPLPPPPEVCDFQLPDLTEPLPPPPLLEEEQTEALPPTPPL